MFRNPLQDGFQPSGIRRFRRKLLFSMQNEQSQKTQQSALDDQFIAWKFGAVGIFDFLQTVRRLRIIQIIRRQMYVQCQTPALQRKNILFGTQISCTTQKFRIKNNILILHILTLCLPECMERTRCKNENIPHISRMRHSTCLNQPGSPLYKDQLHTFLPVECHLREISRNGAGINIKRKTHSPMLFCFPQGNLFLHRYTS